MKWLGWRFFYKNRRPELYFLETGAYLYFLFFYFFIFLPRGSIIWRLAKKCDEIDECSWKGYGFLKQKKEISNPYLLFFCFKNPYSFLDLILWVLKITFQIFSIIVQKFQVIFNTYKNNEKIIRSASAAAQSKCVVFYLLTGVFLIALVEKSMP